MAWYRLRVAWTYSTVASANTAATAINATLAAQSVAQTVTRPTTSSLDLTIDGLTEERAVLLRDLLAVNWATGTRSLGKASIERRDERSP